jgi:hypothetical protein
MTKDFKAGQPPRGKIKLAAARILGAVQTEANRRWQPRTAFVHPAKVSFPPENPGPDVGSQPTTSDAIEVVTTDLSLTGAGILISAPHDPLPERVTLVIDDTAFDCEVRWSKKVGTVMARYGLKFLDVLEELPGQAGQGHGPSG